MKTFVHFAIVAFLSAAPALVSAFAPVIISGSANNAVRPGVSMAAKPAKDAAQDLELTLDIIRKHIASGDDDVVDDELPASQSSSEEGGGEEGKAQPMKKIKSIGSKIKRKVKSKLAKSE